jgi:diguanylate cyclase (GGDEF)-like protein
MSLSQVLDLRTLLAINIVNLGLCVGVMCIAWHDNRHKFPVTGFWVRSLAFQFLSFLLFLLRGHVPDFFSILLAAGLVTTGFMQLIAGLAVHFDFAAPSRRLYVVQALFLGLHAFFTYIDPSFYWRCVNYSVVLAWLSLEAVRLVVIAPANKRHGTLFFAVVMTMYAALFAGRAAFYLFVVPVDADFLHPNDYDLMMYLIIQMLAIALVFSLIMIVNRRLHRDLEDDIMRRLDVESLMRLNLDRLARAELISKTGNWELHLDSREIVASPGAAMIYEIEGERFEFDQIMRVEMPEYRSMIDAAMKRMLESGEPYDVEYRIHAPRTGQVKDIHSVAVYDPAQNAVFGVLQDVTQQKNVERELERIVQTDTLTHVFSRRFFMELAERELANATRYGRELSVLMLDVDHFKAINDAHGHQAGDLVLRSLGQVFGDILREVDIVGRIGGEEFAVVLPETSVLRAYAVAERLRRSVEATSIALKHGLPIKITVSIGIAVASKSQENIDTMLARADQALYDAKHLGRNQVCVHEIRGDGPVAAQ